MEAALLYEVIDEGMGEENRMTVSELNEEIASPWSDRELVSRINDMPTKDGKGFSTDIYHGRRIIERVEYGFA